MGVQGGEDTDAMLFLRPSVSIWGLSLMMLDELMDLVEGSNPQRPKWRRG